MKKALSILVVLGLATLANATFLDNFDSGTVGQAPAGWTSVLADHDASNNPINPVALVLDSGSDLSVYKGDMTSHWGIDSKDLGFSATGVVTLSASFRSFDNNNGRPAGIGIVDAAGKGVIMDVSSYAGNKWNMGVYATNNNGIDLDALGATIPDFADFYSAALDTKVDHVLSMEIDLGTGAWQLYVDGGAFTATAGTPHGTLALPSGMAAPTTALLLDKKRVYIDNFSVTPEPATMAMLAFGGLGMLIRRKR